VIKFGKKYFHKKHGYGDKFLRDMEKFKLTYLVE